MKGCDESAGEMEALLGAGEGESERCESEQEVESPESLREAERWGDEEGEKVVRSLRRGLEGESMRKEGIVVMCLWFGLGLD